MDDLEEALDLLEDARPSEDSWLPRTWYERCAALLAKHNRPKQYDEVA
jgi:hypothetical protein